MAGPEGIDWKAFGASVMHPKMPRLTEAKRVATSLRRELEAGLGSPWADASLAGGSTLMAEATERMTARMDGEWLIDGRRTFLPSVRPEPRRAREGRGAELRNRPRRPATSPWNLETLAMLLGAGEEAVRTAEATALEACERMRPWGLQVPRHVAWTILDPSWPSSRAWFSLFCWPGQMASSLSIGNAEDLYPEVARAILDGARKVSPWRFTALQAAIRCAESWLCWRELVEAKSQVTGWWDGYEPDPPLPSLIGRRFDELPDPLDAVLAVWGMGFVPLDMIGDYVAIGVPWQGRPITAPSAGLWRQSIVRRFAPTVP